MAVVRIECPHCRRPHSVEDSLIGLPGHCEGCGGDFSPTPPPEPSSETWPRPPALPEKIGRFAICERLGAGAFGAVYRAWDPNLEREVALKVPHREVQQDPMASERFLREARAAARLTHPHIVPVYEAGTDGDTSYLACAFIPGRTLADALDDGPFEPRRAARIVAALADALHAAHREGIIHRDVKPSNILLDADDRPRLADFGLARLAGAGHRLTHAGLIIGTPAYLAPEQAGGRSNEAEAPSDQYSLGATFYELLCGRVPFSGPIEIVVFHTLHTPPPLPRAERPDIPPELEAICLRALAKRPEGRYPSCRELADDLKRWEASQAVPSAAGPAPERAPRHPRRIPAIAALAATAILGASTIVWMGREDQPRRPAPDEVVHAHPEIPAPESSPPPLPDLPADVFAGPIAPPEVIAANPVPRAVVAEAPAAPPGSQPNKDAPPPHEPEPLPTARDLRLRGGFLILEDAEDAVSNGIPTLTKQRDAYFAAARRGSSLEKALAADRDARALLVAKHAAVQRAIDDHARRAGAALKNDAVVKKAYGDLQSRLTDLEAEIDRYPTSEALEQRRIRSKEEVEAQRATFSRRVAAVRAEVERTRRAYTQLAGDPEVAARLKEAERTTRKPVKLGPSPGFRSDVEILERLEKSLDGDDPRPTRKPRRR